MYTLDQQRIMDSHTASLDTFGRKRAAENHIAFSKFVGWVYRQGT